MNLFRLGGASETHTVFLDFDGGTRIYRNRELGINLPAVVAPSGMSSCRRAAVIARLNREYARYGIRFTADAGVKHASAVHIGQTSAFDCFGHFSGLAEGIGEGDAFVMLDDSASDTELLEVIRHEAGHLLGTLDHGGTGLSRYAYRYTEYFRYGPHLASVTTRNVSFSALTPPDGEEELYLGYFEGYYAVYYSYNHGEGPTEYYNDSWTLTGYVEASNITAGNVRIEGGKATDVTADTMTIEGGVICDSVCTRTPDGDSVESSNFHFYQGGAYGCVVDLIEITGNAVAKSCTVNTLVVYREEPGENSSGVQAVVENCTVTGGFGLSGGVAKNTIVQYGADAGIYKAAATNLITERGSVTLSDDSELNKAKVGGCITIRGENVKVSGPVTCSSVLITDNFSGAITIKLDLRDYAVAGYTERIEDSNGHLIEEIQYFSNYTTRTTTYNYTYDPFGNEQYSTNVSYGSFDNRNGRFDMDLWGDYRFSVDIGMIYNKAAMSNITLDFGGTEKLFDSGELYVLLPECFEGDAGGVVDFWYQPAVDYYTTIPFDTTSDRNKWRVDEDYTNYRADWLYDTKFSTDTRFIYNPAFHGEAADVLWLDSGWYEDTEYSVELPPEAMSGTMKEVTISDRDGGSSAPIGGVAVKNSKLVIKGGASTGNFTVKAEDSGDREHECDLELIVVPETIPVVGKIGAKRYSEMLKKAQKSRLTKISEFWPYDIETKLFGLKFCLSGLGVSLTVNWTEPTMELKFQGKLDWEIGKGESKNLTLDLSGDNYFAVTHKKGSLGWDLVGELQVPDFKIGKFGFYDMILKVNKEKAAFTVGGYVQLPGINYKFGGSIGIVDGCLDSMSIGVDNLNVPLGSTGLMLQSVSGSVQGIATSLDMTFGGNLGLTFGPKINVQWKFDWLGIDDGEYSLLEINAGVTISTSGEIGGSASLSTLGGFITGGGEIQASEGNFTIKGNFTMLNGCISLTGEFNSDAENGVVITGKGMMAVPRNKFFGPLAGMGFAVNVKADYKERYVMAWENTEIFGNKFSVGVKSSFDGEVELIGASDLLGGDSDLAPEDGPGGRLRVLPGSASDGDGLRGAATPSASRNFLVSGSGLNIFQVNFSVSASIASMSLVYNGDEYTQAAISAGLYENMQIVNELTSSTCLTVAVNNTGSGEWTVNAYGDEKASFGAYSLAGSAAKPAVNAVEVGADGRSATIRYTLGDTSMLENATVSVFRAAGDAVEHNGALIGKFSAADATGNFLYAPADDLPGGSYAFYLMVESGNYAPEYSDLSAACDFITIDTEAPDQIQKVRAEWHSAGSVLSWNVPYDNIGVAGYKVNYRASETDGWTEANVAEAAFTFEGVANAAYTFRVAAYDAAGNVGAWSSEDSVLVNLAANAVYHDVALAEDTALAEFEGAVNVNSENVRLTAAGNTLISNSSIGEAEIGGIIEDSAVAGEVELLAGARGFSLAVTGGLTVGNRTGNETEADPFAEPDTEAEYVDRAVVSDVTVNSEGTLTVGKYGQANNVTVVSGGSVILTDDAEALGLVMDCGTTLTITGQGKYYLADDIRTAGTLNTRRTISANGSKIIFEQYKQTAEYQNDGTGNTMDNVAFTDVMDKLGSNVLEMEIDSSVYGFFKIADQAPYFDGTITVTDYADGSSAAVGFDGFTLVGNALCRLEKFPNGLFLSTSGSTFVAPTVTVEQADSSAFDTVYVKAAPADGSGSIKQVSFRYSLNADMSDAVVVAATYIDFDGSGNLSLSKYDLVDNATYYVQAFVENDYGAKSLWSEAASFTVVPKLLPDAPASMTVTGATDPNCASITFTATGVDDSDYSVRDYRFRYADNPEFENAVIIATGQPYINSASISKEGIVDGKDYYVQAGVKYGSDWSYWSDTVVFNTQGWDYDGITVEATGEYANLTLGSKRARNVTVAEGGCFYGGNGVVDGITVDGGFFRDDGATVSNAVVNGGSYWLSGSVSGIQVNSGELRLMGGTLNGAVIGVDATMSLGSSYQPTVTGTILLQGQMTVDNYQPGVTTDASFVFDLGAHEAAKDKMFIDFTSPLLGSRTFTVKLDDTPEAGDYTLTYVLNSGEFYAGLASADGSNLGVMALGGDAIKHNELYYSLVEQSSRVYLHVSADESPALLGKVKLSRNGTAYDSNDYYNDLTVSAASACDHVLVEAGGLLTSVTVGNGGAADVCGEVCGATIENGGRFTMNAGGLFYGNPVTISQGGEVIINGGSIQQGAKFKIAGTLTVNGALQSYEDDGDSYYATYHEFTFCLGQFTAPNETVLINDYELVKTCSASFSVSVSANQAEGEYQLMGNAASYAFGVTLYIEGGTSSGDYIWFGGNGSEINGRNYALSVKNDVLTLTVGSVIPEPPIIPSDVIARTQMWDQPSDSGSYVVEYSTDNFEHAARITVYDTALDSYAAPAGCQWRVRPTGSGEWTEPDTIYGVPMDDDPKFVRANDDGVDDVFFARANGTWSGNYQAQHVGSLDSEWTGTGERVGLVGKNRLGDLFEGSYDANVLLLTDDANGDALFVDDIYTALPGSVAEQQARIAQIYEIRAGAGDDIVDMTSQRFEYIGEGLTIRGGDGDDTIWAVGYGSYLFGDAGNDRIVGGFGLDFIAGGSGNDSMHGGGGRDVFTFGANWGNDIVEQLTDDESQVMLWFAEGDHANWNASTLTYTDGVNSVTVKGVTADQIEIYIGDEFPRDFEMMSELGIFADATSEKVFEEKAKGLLA